MLYIRTGCLVSRSQDFSVGTLSAATTMSSSVGDGSPDFD